MSSQVTDPRIIVALDYPSAPEALRMAGLLDPGRCRVKVGKELFTAAGPALIERLSADGFEVFLDLKFHDIPNTVAGACAAAAALGVWMVNVHALGGRRMMEAAREAVNKGPHVPKLIAVTVLTSMEARDIQEVGLAGTPAENVQRLANLAHASGMDGVVCSPQEVDVLRRQWASGCLVTPGIRPGGSQAGDQKRIMTPGQAIAAGADYLVIGRPITGAPDPLQALLAVETEIAAVTAPGA